MTSAAEIHRDKLARYDHQRASLKTGDTVIVSEDFYFTVAGFYREGRRHMCEIDVVCNGEAKSDRCAASTIRKLIRDNTATVERRPYDEWVKIYG